MVRASGRRGSSTITAALRTEGERTNGLEFRSGYHVRALITCVGTLELRMLQDSLYKRVRTGGLIMSQVALIAIGIDWEGRRARGRRDRGLP
jgi:transposase-like protein